MEKKIVPMKIDADAIAKGLLKLFDEDELVALRFGMLPARKMELLDRIVEEKILSSLSGKRVTEDGFVLPDSKEKAREEVKRGDSAMTGEDGLISLKRLKRELVHEISLAIYKIGDLVV